VLKRLGRHASWLAACRASSVAEQADFDALGARTRKVTQRSGSTSGEDEGLSTRVICERRRQ
jgi:hypothetical protein